MKSIKEYSFRDIVGRFVIMQFPMGRYLIDPEFDQFIAYVYIDTEAGMTFEIIGGYKDGQIHRNPTSSCKVRYTDDILMELYENPDAEMIETAKFIEDNYTPNWIGQLRDNPVYDPYRDKQYPDDLLLLIATFVDKKIQFEKLWVRPIAMEEDDFILAKTIEAGKLIPMESEVAIVSNRILGGKTFFDIPDIIAVDDKIAEFLVNRLE